MAAAAAGSSSPVVFAYNGAVFVTWPIVCIIADGEPGYEEYLQHARSYVDAPLPDMRDLLNADGSLIDLNDPLSYTYHDLMYHLSTSGGIDKLFVTARMDDRVEDLYVTMVMIGELCLGYHKNGDDDPVVLSLYGHNTSKVFLSELISSMNSRGINTYSLQGETLYGSSKKKPWILSIDTPTKPHEIDAVKTSIATLAAHNSGIVIRARNVRAPTYGRSMQSAIFNDAIKNLDGGLARQIKFERGILHVKAVLTYLAHIARFPRLFVPRGMDVVLQ